MRVNFSDRRLPAGARPKKTLARARSATAGGCGRSGLSDGGRHQAEQFKAKYGALPQGRDRNSIYSYNRPAAKLDLFFYPTGTYTASNLLPEDLRLKLKAFVPEPKTLTLPIAEQPPQTFRVEHRYFDYQKRQSVATVEEVPVVCGPTEQVAQQDLLAVLRLIYLGKVNLFLCAFPHPLCWRLRLGYIVMVLEPQ